MTISPRASYNLPNDGRCPHCGAPLEVGPATPPHHAEAICIDCGFGGRPLHIAFLVDPTKPDRAKSRRDANAAWKSLHQDEDGSVMCVICLETSHRRPDLSFAVDHVIPLGPPFGGPDTFENTRILCSDCHTIRHVLERSARRRRTDTAA
jgi:5-methylcytosine-specific restriction endonuclease McrA